MGQKDPHGHRFEPFCGKRRNLPSAGKNHAVVQAMDRIGVDKMEAALFSDDLLNRKEEILAAPVKERA